MPLKDKEINRDATFHSLSPIKTIIWLNASFVRTEKFKLNLLEEKT
jgi:hypothetical protein